MIVIETKLKKIPETCTKCKFSETVPIYIEEGLWEHFTGNYTRRCSITHKEVPYVYIKERKNWCYTKCKNCPLKDLSEEQKTYFVIKDGRTISDYNNKEEAEKHARDIGGEIAVND